MDPTLWTDFSGWRHIMIGSAEGFAGVVEWQENDHYLVVLAPILDIPEGTDQLLTFYRMLLELNYHGTLSAHFSIHEDTLYLGITRPIRGLDEEEVDEAIRTVMILADSYDDRLQELIHLIPPSLPKLPDISMRPKDAQIIGLTLSACDVHGQTIFRFLMEQWVARGFMVEAGTTGIALSILLGDQPYALAALHPGFADRKQEIILSWEGLHRRTEFSEESIRQFQEDTLKIGDIKTTANTGHLEVTEQFSEESANLLLEIMAKFAKTAKDELTKGEVGITDVELSDLSMDLEPSTLRFIEDTLELCESHSHRIFLKLVQDWHTAGGIVTCNSPGRIYLKLNTKEQDCGNYGVLSHNINLAVLVSPSTVKPASIELAWNLAEGQFAYLEYAFEAVQEYERIISDLPGFTDLGHQREIIFSEYFEDEHLTLLLKALLDLRASA
jgi:hypothetical protein